MNKPDNKFSHAAEIRSVSEDTSKPQRTFSVRMVQETGKYTNKQIVVAVPNVRKPIPLFILMRALGVISDKEDDNTERHSGTGSYKSISISSTITNTSYTFL